jgi:hypothetical protein
VGSKEKAPVNFEIPIPSASALHLTGIALKHNPGLIRRNAICIATRIPTVCANMPENS